MFLCVYYLRRRDRHALARHVRAMSDRDRDPQTMLVRYLLAGAVLLTPHSPNSRRAISGSP